ARPPTGSDAIAAAHGCPRAPLLSSWPGYRRRGAEPRRASASPGFGGRRAVGAQVPEYACATARLPGPADRSPVGNHREVQVVADAGWHERREELMRTVRGRLCLDPAKPNGHAVHMGVDRESRSPHGECENARRRLASHAW